MSVEAVIFDWGGTLTPYHRIDYLAAWHEIASALAPDRADELARALLGAEEEMWRRAREERRSGHMTEVCELAGVPFDEAYREAFVRTWEAHTYTDPDAAPTLRGLRERGIAVGLLSNTTWPRHWHDEFLDRDGVLDLFDATTYTSELDHVKPHPEAFHAAMAEVGVADPGAVVFVGDRAFDDVRGASDVGMRTVLVPHSDIPETERWGRPAEPDAVVHRLADVLPVVDRWRASA